MMCASPSLRTPWIRRAPLPRLTLLLCLATGPSALAADRYVATNGNDTTHDSWSTAYTNLQDALNAAANGDTIYLAGRTLVLTNQLVWQADTNVTIRGGYAASNDVSLPGPRDPTQWPTVLARTGGGNFRVLSISGVSSGTLDGVTLTGGYQPDVSGGGGILLSNCGGMLLSGCAITNNRTQGNNAPGGGICSKDSVVTVSNCLVRDNSILCANGGLGGGVYAGGTGSMTLRDSIIANNVLYGGYVRNGGGIWAGTTCVMQNCLVIGNTASEEHYSGYYKHGDGLYVSGGSTRLENCTVAYNAGQGIYQSAGTVAMTNSIVWGNGDDIIGSLALGYSSIEDGDSNGVNGNLSLDPLFERGFYLASNSPCTNAGTGSAADRGLGSPYTTQTDGSPDAGTVDMGYHYPTGYDFSHGDFYAATNGSDGNSGTNWAGAFRTITKALAQSRDGTKVHVGSGSYTMGSGETFPLTAANLMSVHILGTNRETTVINAAGSNKRVMYIHGNNVTLQGLALTGGYQPDASGGGGILLSNCGGVLLSGCAITNNGMVGNSAPGGGICSKDSVVTVSNCLVSGNTILCANGGLGGGDLYGRRRGHDAA